MDEKGSLDKAAVISALQSSGDADYDSVCPPSFSDLPFVTPYSLCGGGQTRHARPAHAGYEDVS